VLDVVHVALGCFPERDAFLRGEDLDFADLAAECRLGLLARETVARPRLPDGAELALDLPVAGVSD
jgi:hypothetical protein